ncbi:glycosyltransferase family 2 protein [Anaeromyxobacter paludicola]|uniref:Glycosyltransferase 2-like domain-containing protein n=1 Tax=Anaeromyxobacter paludicola TaxID=2918171 RepID=A0ABN6N7T8_9BACT|nr:glycosyltransferase family 2 protein [Anaeromyxobacter paludicola]BDG08002.1 hypothetical protein AMPC_11150 [Anaeromyxobacter paludicola]
MSRPRLSLCLLVRDEAELLPRFLAAARGLWDELVAVDTGSSDATPALLAAAGARVLRRPWTGDFAAGRNAGLEVARGEWIAWLDPDELVSPALVAEARRALADPAAGAASLRMRNHLPHGHVREARLLRLFRADPAIRFRHAIHEDVGPDVAAMLARTGRRRVDLEGAVEHLGYVRARAAAKDKKARDVAILDACVARDPGDLYAWFKLLEQARFWGDRALWHARAAPGLAAAERDPAALARAHFGGEWLVLLSEGLHPGDPAAQHRFLALRERAVPRAAPLLLRLGELEERLGRAAEAARRFEACLALAPETEQVQLATVRPTLGLARLALGRGDLPAARRRVDAAASAAPHDPEALVAAASLARIAGGAPAAARFAEEHAARHGESEELLQALGEAALLAGDAAGACAPLARVAGDPPRGRGALRLAQALFAAGEVARAREACAAVLAELPEAALGILTCDLALGRDSALEVELGPAEAEAALRGWAAVSRLAPAPVRAALALRAEAVAEPFPWFAAAVR